MVLVTTVLVVILVASRVPVLNSTTDVTQSSGNALIQITLAAGVERPTFPKLTVTVHA